LPPLVCDHAGSLSAAASWSLDGHAGASNVIKSTRWECWAPLVRHQAWPGTTTQPSSWSKNLD